jgi:hypothetical protein
LNVANCVSRHVFRRFESLLPGLPGHRSADRT